MAFTLNLTYIIRNQNGKYVKQEILTQHTEVIFKWTHFYLDRKKRTRDRHRHARTHKHIDFKWQKGIVNSFHRHLKCLVLQFIKRNLNLKSTRKRKHFLFLSNEKHETNKITLLTINKVHDFFLFFCFKLRFFAFFYLALKWNEKRRTKKLKWLRKVPTARVRNKLNLIV